MSFNRSIFFNRIRGSIFGGSLTTSQVSGIEGTIEAFELFGSGDRRHLSYILATEVRETGGRMQPVREGFATTDAGARAAVAKLYAQGKIKTNYALPNKAGRSFYGRGKVQITWEDNYRRLGAILGLDLVNNPDLALDPTISARIMIEGMLRAGSLKGDFSGKALEDYIAGTKCDYVRARRTVNGSDHAAEIARNAIKFEAALIAAGTSNILMPKPAVPETTIPVANVVPEPPAKTGLSGFLARIFKRAA